MDKTEIESSFKCHKCGKPGYKTDGECKIWCEKCLNIEIHPPVKLPEPKIQRNEPCPCGSNLKYKKCCGHGNKN